MTTVSKGGLYIGRKSSDQDSLVFILDDAGNELTVLILHELEVIERLEGAFHVPLKKNSHCVVTFAFQVSLTWRDAAICAQVASYDDGTVALLQLSNRDGLVALHPPAHLEVEWLINTILTQRLLLEDDKVVGVNIVTGRSLIVEPAWDLDKVGLVGFARLVGF